MHYIKVSIKLNWGYTVRELFSSKTRESYLIPPPTTLIGALAYGYARLHKIPEEDIDRGGVSSAERIRSIIISVNEKALTPLIHYADISKIWWYRSREGIAKYDAVAFGKVYKGVSTETRDLEVIYIVKEQDHAKNLAAAAHSMIRIGGSYGLASVENIEYGKLTCIEENKAKTKYSFWNDLAVSYNPGNLHIQEVIDYRKTTMGSYVAAPLRRRIYPYSKAMMSPVEVEVEIDRTKATICKAGDEAIIVEQQ